MTEELLYAPDGSVTGVHHAGPSTTCFPAFAVQGLDQETKGTFSRGELAPLAKVNVESTPRNTAFSLTPSKRQAAEGRLAGAIELPITGPGWQVMRVSRNRHWGNPNLIAFVERLADHAKKIGWNGILIGDLSQPRGGPMLTGHSSHQIGLDVDMWFTPAPDHELSEEEREFNLAQNMVAEDRRDVDPKVWTSAHTEVVRAAAEDSAVSRIFVNPAIKKAMCREAGGRRGWLAKVRPWWHHEDHFHVRLACPAGAPNASRSRYRLRRKGAVTN